MHKGRIFSLVLLMVSVTLVTGLLIFWFQGSSARGSALSDGAGQESSQMNTLLIITDRIDSAQARLRSIWLVIYSNNSSSLSLLPIFPASAGASPLNTANITDTFGLTPNQAPTEEFLAAFDQEHIRWDAFFVIDEVVLGKFVGLAGGLLVNGQLVNENEVLTGNYISRDNGDIIQVQTRMLDELCQKIPLMNLHPDFDQTIAFTLQHANSSLSLDTLKSGWSAMRNPNQQLSCEFLADKPAIAQSSLPK